MVEKHIAHHHTSQLEILFFPVLEDNYAYLIHHPQSGETACVDSPDADAIVAVLKKQNWSLHYVFNTHHHWDHVNGNAVLKQQTGCRIIGYEGDKERLPAVDECLKDGATFMLGDVSFELLHLPGHTDHICGWYSASQDLLFVGDVVFTLGCGRLFEGTAAQMLASIKKIVALPDNTHIFSAHEYALSNALFAQTMDPSNPELQKRVKQIQHNARHHIASQPTTVMAEKSTNPFFRTHSHVIAQSLDKVGEAEDAIFAELRRRKDCFA